MSEVQSKSEQYVTLQQEFDAAVGYSSAFRQRWNTFLDIAYARLTTEKGFRSRVREGSLSSLIWERAARVTAQIPTGKIQALTSRDEGKNQLMNVVWNNYIIPGANTDYSFKLKLRMWDYYSLVFGAMPTLYDYRIDDEYVGPDFKVIDPKYCFPQAGRLSLQSCMYVFHEAFYDREFLDARLKMEGWEHGEIQEILNAYDKNKTPDTSDRTTNLQNERGEGADLHKGAIRLVTKYQRGKEGRWITFAPDYDCRVVRDIKNPHESGRIPIVFKWAMPLLDSIWGMGDVERGESLQKAVDTAVNLNLDFGKFKLYPPMYYKSGLNASQYRYEPGAKWKVNDPDDVGFIRADGSYTNEFQTMYQFLKGALLNQNGTTDTSISSNDGLPGYGKTPGAIEKLEKRENARDAWDRDMFEEAYEDLASGMINLIGTKQPAPISIHVFDEDIKRIAEAGYADVLELYDSAKKHTVVEEGVEGEIPKIEYGDKGTAKLTVKEGALSARYMFRVDGGTSAANDEKEEFERIDMVIDKLNTPAGQKMLEGAIQSGSTFNAGELLHQYINASGIKGRDKIIARQAGGGDGGGSNPQGGGNFFNPNSLQTDEAKKLYSQFKASQQSIQPEGAVA